MLDVSNLCQTLRQAKFIDLSQAYEEHMPNFPTHSKFYHNLWGSYWHGDRALHYQLVMSEHNGTWSMVT
jgi:kynurenine formamidase